MYMCGEFISADDFQRWLRKQAEESAARLGLDPEFQRDPEGYVHKVMMDFRMSLGLHSARRRFVVTRNGYMALVPEGSREGDVFVILYGTQVPSVLRRCEDDRTTEEKEERIGVGGEEMRQRTVGEDNARSYQFVGECYVHGDMNGELIVGDSDSRFENFVLR